MTTDELNAIVQAVMTELEKAGVDFDFKAETPQATDLVYVMRGTSDKYQGITVKWQNLLDIIVQKATEAKNEAVSAKDIALQTLATIQGIESNVSTMKASVETMKSDVSTMKTSVEASEANVTQMKASVEGTKTEVEGLKVQTQTIVDNAEEQVTGLLNTKADVTYVDGELAKKVNYTDSLSYEEIMATNPVPDLTNKVASASALKNIGNKVIGKVDYVGNLITVDGIKTWVVQNKPSNPWVAWAGNSVHTTVLGLPFNDVSGGYVAFLAFNYFSSSVDIYTLNAGSWNK